MGKKKQEPVVLAPPPVAKHQELSVYDGFGNLVTRVLLPAGGSNLSYLQPDRVARKIEIRQLDERGEVIPVSDPLFLHVRDSLEDYDALRD